MKEKLVKNRKVNFGYYGSGPRHPVIRLAGKYLEQFDFTIGDQIEVNISPREITIRKTGNTCPTNKIPG